MSDTRTCELCGQPFHRSTKRGSQGIEAFSKRRFCSPRCASHGTAQERAAAEERRRQQTIEDFEWIAGTDRPERIAARLGYASLHNLERNLYRWGRPDLARQLMHSNEVSA